jgi:membrane protease YdiL (CAAX protease family)
LVVLVIVLPTAILATLGEAVPAAAGTVVALLTLPVAALVSWRLMRSEPGKLGLGRPDSWGRTVALGLLVGAGVLLVATLLITPLLEAVFGVWLKAEMFDPYTGNVGALAINLLLVSWLHAAFCEEIIFRGFLLQRIEGALGSSRSALPVAIGLSSLLFGLAHYPQGVPGIIATALGGLLWAAAYLRWERNLWIVIVGHATVDTTLAVLVFLGQHRLLLSG